MDSAPFNKIWVAISVSSQHLPNTAPFTTRVRKSRFSGAAFPYLCKSTQSAASFFPTRADRHGRAVMFTCVHAELSTLFYSSAYSLCRAAAVTPLHQRASPPPSSANVSAPARRQPKSRSPAPQATKRPRRRTSSSSVCSFFRSLRSIPRMPPVMQRSAQPHLSFLLPQPHSASVQPSPPATQAPTRSTRERPARIFLRTKPLIPSAPQKNLPCIRLHERMSGEVLLCCFLFPHLISGSKLGFSSFSALSAGASTVLGSSTFAGSSSFFSSFLAKEDFLPFCAAAASIDSVD